MYKHLEEFAEMLKANGYKVFGAKWRSDEELSNYIYFVDANDKIGYCQCDKHGVLEFSTLHKGSIANGSSYPVGPEGHTYSVQDSEEELLEAAHEAANMCRPTWATGTLEKWSGWEEFYEATTTCELVELQLIMSKN